MTIISAHIAPRTAPTLAASRQAQPSQRVDRLTTTLITKLLTNPLSQSQSTTDPGDRSPASAPVHHTGRLSMAWKEPERRTWAQSGPNARDWASQNACLIGGGYFIHGRFRPIDTSPPIWGSRGREFKSRQPDQTIHFIRPSRTCIQPAFLPPSMTPSGGRSGPATDHQAENAVPASSMACTSGCR
jgi:hypothetical protein